MATARSQSSRETSMPSVNEEQNRMQQRRERKKIQNRMAQRTYRDRIKTRLQELQSQVDCYEQKATSEEAQGGASPETDHDPGHHSSSTEALWTLDPLLHADLIATDSGADGMEASDTGRLANPEAPLQTPHDVEEPRNLSIDIESMERQTFPESYYDATHELGLNDFDISTDEPSTVSGIVDPAQAERDMCGPRDFVGITFDFDSPNNHRIAQESVMLAQTNDQPPCFSDVLDSSTSTQLPSVQFDYDASVSNFEAMGSARTDSDAYLVKDTPDMDGRFEGLLEYSRAMGFDSFDSLATAYYSHNFDVSSPLATVQRLSRNRHLPKVLADVLDAAKGWSDWERHGLHAEIMKQAESILVSEADRASSALNVSIDQFVEAQDPARISPTTAGTVLGVRRTIEREVCVPE